MKHDRDSEGFERITGLGRCAKTGLHLFLQPLTQTMSTAGWKDLSGRLAVPNVFYEPAYAIPAAIAFGDGVQFMTVTEGAAPGTRMLAAWPVRVSYRRWGVPLGAVVGWTHPFAALGVPLLDKDRAADALGALMRCSSISGKLPRTIYLPNVLDEGPFAELLQALERDEGFQSCSFLAHTRPKLTTGLREGYFDAHLSSKTRSKLRQEFRRIEKSGTTVFETISEPGAVAEALEDYIALEGRGWKGRAGTAAGCSPHESDFLRGAVTALAAQDRVRIHRLRLDDTTIASSVTYLSGDAVWYAKISFDEAQAKNSPGSQLVMYATNEFLANPGVSWGDSCAPAGHPLMRKFWADEMRISNRLVAPPGSGPLLRLASGLERLRLKASDIWQRHRARRIAAAQKNAETVQQATPDR